MSDPGFRSRAPFLRPGISGGFYPERPHSPARLPAGILHGLLGIVKIMDVARYSFGPILDAIHRHGLLFETLSDAGLADKAQELRRLLHRHGLTGALTSQAFALVRETAGRTVGMRHYDSQLQGGWVMVHGRLAEMETGEGKTLTATLAAAAAGLTGIPVHIVTVNDYLARRDAELMGPVYRALGLTVGTATAAMDDASRRAAYGCDIAYCTNKQLAFDYLRDRILLGNDHGRMRLQLERLHSDNARTRRLFLRGLCFAIIDEADSVLIDEARTPLVISRKHEGSEEEATFRQAMALAMELQDTTDFIVDHGHRRVVLSDRGSSRLAEAAGRLGGIWHGTRRREELVGKALAAQHLYCRDRHYLVEGGKVLIVDENTGRTMKDRLWERGLHQMIEIKESCRVTGRREPMARLTYQRFFRRYLHLAGMTGTAREVRRELWSVYGLSVSRIPPFKPNRRRELGWQICVDKETKFVMIVQRIRAMMAEERPVLVGTRSVADSETLGRLLSRDGLAHRVLNARQDAEEAEIIARAGTGSAITIATNMAGRGTDIPLGQGVAGIGGLHIIVTESNEARRIDRQLYGRCGRQGDPGSYESILSLEDELLQTHFSPVIRLILGRLIGRDRLDCQYLGLLAVRLAQAAQERRDLHLRRDLLQAEEQLDRLLAFSGRME
jgi:preprotein translocase subunit SecA